MTIDEKKLEEWQRLVAAVEPPWRTEDYGVRSMGMHEMAEWRAACHELEMAARIAIPDLIAAYRAAERELERHRHGTTIEGDFVCPNEVTISELSSAFEAMRIDNHDLTAKVAALESDLAARTVERDEAREQKLAERAIAQEWEERCFAARNDLAERTAECERLREEVRVGDRSHEAEVALSDALIGERNDARAQLAAVTTEMDDHRRSQSEAESMYAGACENLAAVRAERDRLRFRGDSLIDQIEHEGCAFADVGQRTYECNVTAPCGLCRLRGERDAMRPVVEATLRACAETLSADHALHDAVDAYESAQKERG